jgi:hypothetical protein
MTNFFKDKFFRKELKKEARIFIVVAVAFSVAFAWRQTIFDAALVAVNNLFTINGEIKASILASTLITLIGIIIILLSSKLLKDAY